MIKKAYLICLSLVIFGNLVAVEEVTGCKSCRGRSKTQDQPAPYEYYEDYLKAVESAELKVESDE